MVERRGRRPARRLAVATRNFYQSVLQEAETTTLAEAEGAEGLIDEVAMLRVLVRRQMESDPENVELVLKSLRVLVQMIKVQFGLSGADVAALREAMDHFARQTAKALLGEEGDDGGPA